MYTDGITDAMNAAEQLYGLHRLRTQLQPRADSVKAFGRRILDDVRRFVGNHPQTDDMCVACLGRLGE